MLPTAKQHNANMGALIVVPAFNESEKIAHVVAQLQKAGYTSILVVDDGSTDATSEAARAQGAMVIRHRLNCGQGAALETGNQYARQNGFDTVVHFDADDQHVASDIGPALAALKEKNLDAVLGSRFLGGSAGMPITKRFLLLPLARCINFCFTGVLLTDAHNGFRILGKKALEKIQIQQPGMAHNTEIVAALRKHGLQFAEVPVTVQYHRYGQGIVGGVRVVIDLLKTLFV